MAFERLSEEEWILLESLVKTGKSLRGRPPKQHRKIFEAVFWIASCDVPWRSLPEKFGKWNTVYRQFKRWTEADLWNRIINELDANPQTAEHYNNLRQNAMATLRLAEQRTARPPTPPGPRSTIGSSGTRHSLGGGKTLEAQSVNL